MAAPTVRARTTPAAGISTTSPASTEIGDLVLVFTWERAGAGVPTHTVQATFNELQSVNHNDGSTDGRLSVAWKRATAAGANSYQAYTSSNGTETWTGCIVVTSGTWSTTLSSNQVSQTGTGTLDAPSVTLGNTRDWLVVAIAAYHHGSSATITPTAPANYINLQEVAGSSTGDVASAERSLTAPASEDPGTFGDNITPNGTCGVTVGIPSVITLNPVAQITPIPLTIDSAMVKTLITVSPSAAAATAGAGTPEGLDITVGPSAAAATAACGTTVIDIEGGGAEEQFAVAALDLSPSIATALSAERFAATTTPLEYTVATALSREAFLAVADPLELTIASAVTREQFLAVTEDLAPVVATALSREAFMAVTTPCDVTIVVRLTPPSQPNTTYKFATALGVG